jgi:Meiotically Up-regulated Gene 113 (MUG113) protein
MKALATSHYAEMTVLATIRDAMPALEEELHQRFAHCRVKREWFKAVPELLAFIEELKANSEGPPQV